MKNNENKDKKIQIYGMLVSAACFIPVAIVGWLEYLKVSRMIINIFSVISSISCPIGVFIFVFFTDMVYGHIAEDLRNKIDLKEKKKIDIFYRYIPSDIIKFGLMFTFFGIGTAIVYTTKETDPIVRFFGDKMLFEGVILSTLAIIFYTLWAIYCNDFNNKKGKIKYMFVIAAIIAVTIFLITNG